MSGIGARFRIEDDQALYDLLDGVKVGVANRALKKILGTLALRGQRKAKGFLNKRRTGQLQRSLGTRFRRYQGGTLFAYVVAPRRGFRAADAAGNPVDPRYYAHLVEKGRQEVRPKTAWRLSDGKVVYGLRARAVGASPFMAPAEADVRAVRARTVQHQLKDALRVIEGQYKRKKKSIRYEG